ncbi:MAG: efflux RND transporter periplasmic adaptor subunit [Gemmataceae bacterium]|nr:efflux RND transporter periplasmic adaptor subunit [Gemmataceae bacterium]
MKWWLSLVVVVALAGCGLGYWYVQASSPKGPSFRTAVVERANLSATISATGTIEPEEVVDVGAQVAGMIKTFGPDIRDSTKFIDYRSEVEKDTILAQIDDSLYRAQMEQAKANVQRAEADLIQMKARIVQTERDWRRAQVLGPNKGVISGLDYDNTLAAYETAKSALAVGDAMVAQAKAALKQAETNLDYCTIRSPVKGVIVDRRVNVGQTVVSSLNAPSLFLIAKDLRRLQIWASVNEADIGQIRPGQQVKFSVDAHPNDVFDGTVAQIRLNATMTQNVVTYTVVVNTDNSKAKLLPYLTANLQFQVDKHENVLQVPNAALRWKPQPAQIAPDARGAFIAQKRMQNDKSEAEQLNRGTVWVEDNGFVRPIKVQTGLNDGANTEIVNGDLNETTRVVIGLAQSSSGGGSSNPFTPKMFGGGKKD